MTLVSALHSFHIIHRDIKPENLLYDELNDSVSLIDFGLSYQIKNESEWLTKPCGSPGYVAPEIIT